MTIVQIRCGYHWFITKMKPTLETIAAELNGHSVQEFFGYVRERHLHSDYVLDETLESVMNAIAHQIKLAPEQVWASSRFQLQFRATTPEHMLLLGLNAFYEQAKNAVDSGRQMSILPYNTLFPIETVRKFIPARSDKFSGKWRHSMDPYGIFRGMDRVIAIDQGGKERYLATRKFPDAVLANITESCPIGCDGCYKGSMIRTALASLAEIYPEYAEIKQQLSLQQDRAVEQARLLTQWLNLHPEVDTIVMSGGEPTLFSNKALEGILNEYKKAQHVRVVRMCTSSVFQGMWYRIDDQFVGMLKDFETSTGKQFYINAHVTDEHQLMADEANAAVRKLSAAGISVHLQMPVQEGINFKRDDLGYSTEKLRKISKEAYARGVVPYKAIVDMHSPSDPELTVPIETVSKVIGFLDQHEMNSDHERWQAYNVLHEQGNLYLYPWPHLTAVKDIEEDHVTYYIPKVEVGERKRVVVHTYTEPKIPGHNDDLESLSKIRDKDVVARIAEVRIVHRELRTAIAQIEAAVLPFGEKAKRIAPLEKEFYRVSGIEYAENEPLILN